MFGGFARVFGFSFQTVAETWPGCLVILWDSSLKDTRLGDRLMSFT